MSIFENTTEETYSQKIARRFEMVCYLLLLPTAVSLIFPIMAILRWLNDRIHDRPPLYSLMPFLIVAPGLALLLGYRKHARGNLAEKHVPVLWLGTAVYNFLLLLPCLYAASFILQETRAYHETTIAGLPTAFYFFLSLILGYIFAISFSLKANMSENRKKLC